MEEVGTSDKVTAAAAAVVVVVAAAAVVVAAVAAGVSENMVMAGPAGHDLEAVGLEVVDLLVVVVVVAAAVVVVVVVVVVGGLAAAAVGFAAVVAALAQRVVGTQAGPESPVDFADQVPAAAAAVVVVDSAVAGEIHRVAVLAETAGAGYTEADSEEGRGDLEIVGMGVLAARVGLQSVKDGPVGGMKVQRFPGVGQSMEVAAVQGEVQGHADHSSPDFAVHSLLGPVVHMLTSVVRIACHSWFRVVGSASP